MAEGADTAARYIKPEQSLDELRQIASGCTACDLYIDATQTVFGEGPAKARIMLVGEQPGDAEDLAGQPFVGPSGALLDKALTAAGIVRDDVYVTNVVKHYRYVIRGKKRLHQKPKIIQIQACMPWLLAEIGRVAPHTIVALGATAAQALFGKAFRVTRDRGRPTESGLASNAFATVHPSSILRASSREGRQVEYDRFVADLRQVAASL